MSNPNDLFLLFNKKGKKERENERRNIKEKVIRIDLDPTTATEKIIYDNYLELRSIMQGNKALLPSKALNIYLQVRYSRHDLWVEYIERQSLHNNRMGDVSVKDFLKKMNIKEYDETNIAVNKTPDILYYEHREGVVILGDVAVSRSHFITEKSKYEKYACVDRFLSGFGFRVYRANFIVDEGLFNIENLIRKFCDKGIIRHNIREAEKAKKFHETANRVMSYCHEYCSNRVEFKKLLSENDNVDDEEIDFDMPEELIKGGVNMERPTKDNEFFAELIRAKVEDNIDTFFSSNITNVINEFEKIDNNNKSKEEFALPKSVLKVSGNFHSYEEYSNFKLIEDFINDIRTSEDNDIKDYILNIMPNSKQNEAMSNIYRENRKGKQPELKVYGPNQYLMNMSNINPISMDLKDKLKIGKRIANTKKGPKCINPDDYNSSIRFIEEYINYLGLVSSKDMFLDDSWDAKTNMETENTQYEKEIYNYCKSTNGAQACHSMSNLYHRIMHIKTAHGTKDNIYVPPNGSFIAIIPKEHGPISGKNCGLPFIFISRHRNIDETKMIHEYEHELKTESYTYYVTKLCRLSINKIAHWDQAGYKLVATASYLMSINQELYNIKEKVVGTLTLLILDGHQKTSEYLDLMKYISFMPFANISMLDQLVKDKMDLLIKTSLDVWLYNKLKSFIVELADIDKLDASKPKLHLYNANVTHESLGLNIRLPSFIDNSIRHTNAGQYIEEITLVYMVRPKHLYGSQFMDSSIIKTAEWNHQYEEEIKKYGNWVTNGTNNEIYGTEIDENGVKNDVFIEDDFPFDSHFAFSKDAILLAQDCMNGKILATQSKVFKKIRTTTFFDYMHQNCSLRGCTKSKHRRKNQQDIHTTSMEECLDYYSKNEYIDERCTALNIANEFYKKREIMQFSMSEKDQRGGGRPIATPTLGAKASLMIIEKPENAIGKLTDNNIIVDGKNKLKEQCEYYKKCIGDGAISNYKKVYQLTEDQSKFSENDNVRKYIPYINNNVLLPEKVRSAQLKVIEMVNKREHLVHRIPDKILHDPNLSKYVNDDKNGIRAIIGWPQGMLNFISTSIHSMADYWITEIYNIAYPNEKVLTFGLVHSDDSWVTVACDNEETFKKFTLFRIYAKRLFCLKLNIKKLWGSMHLGEIVSNYNINGNVHLSVAKTLTNSFNNVNYQNWVMDSHSQISMIQQSYRNGATIPTLILMSTILRQQLVDCYQVKGIQRELLHLLPIELGGYPDNPTFELGVTGVNCHYNKLLNNVMIDPESIPSKIMLTALTLSINHKSFNVTAGGVISKYHPSLLEQIEKSTLTDFRDIDYQGVIIPSRGEVFSCIKHILPKSRKLQETIKRIRELPYETDNLEMIVTKPRKLSVALGHLKSQCSSMIYELASTRYTQNLRRLAISQAIQTSGKVVWIDDIGSLTMNEMLSLFRDLRLPNLMSIGLLEIALSDDGDSNFITSDVIYNSEFTLSQYDKRKIINRMPEVEDKFKTIANLRNVLLRLIDNIKGSRLLQEYGNDTEHLETIDADAKLIRNRFDTYFKFYSTEYACNLIMQQFLFKSKTRVWMQPKLRDDNLTSFLCDLYGATLSNVINYKVICTLKKTTRTADRDDVNTIYTVSVLNKLYPGIFEIDEFDNIRINEYIQGIEYNKLDENDLMRLGILRHLYLNNDDIIKMIDDTKNYDQLYIESQKYIANRYVGKFKCLVKYCNTNMIFRGEPGNMTIETDNTNIDIILKAMDIFVKKNFKTYSYNHPYSWHMSPFWVNRNMAELLGLCLVGYSNSITLLKDGTNSVNKMPCIINRNIRHITTPRQPSNYSFEIDETLRTIYKTDNNNPENNRIIVGKVPQCLTASTLSKVKLKHATIDGYFNDDFLTNKLIINLTLQRYNNCKKEQILSMIKNRLTKTEMTPVVNFLYNVINCIKKTDFIPILHEPEVQCEIEDFCVDGATSLSIFKDYNETEPDDLQYNECDFIIDDKVRIFRVAKYKNFTDVFAKILTVGLSDTDRDYFIKEVIRNNEIGTWLLTMADINMREPDTIYQFINTYYYALDIDITVILTILGFGLNDPDNWKKIKINKILSDDVIYKVENRTIKMTEIAIRQIITVIIGKEDKDPFDIIRSRLGDE